MSVSLTRRRTHCLVVGLVVLLAGLTLSAVAQGWRRPADLAISDPEGGEFAVCRDGIRFQVARGETDVGADPPPFVPAPLSFTVLSPPQDLSSIDPESIIARGEVTFERLTTPLQLEDPEFQGIVYHFLGTVTERWLGGRLLVPGRDIVQLFDSAAAEYGVEDCFLFPPTSKEQCKKDGWRKFRLLAFKNQGQCVASAQRGPKP